MNFGSGPGMQLPRNFGNKGMNGVQPVQPADRTFKSIDGTVWGSFEEASQHNKRYYYEQDKFKNNHFNK